MLTKTFLVVFAAAVILSADDIETMKVGKDTRVADAAQQGDRAAIQALIAQKTDVNAPEGDGMTALHWAASRGDVGVAEMLLKAGADVKAKTRINAQTPLFLAAKNGNARMVEMLVSAGADVNAADARDTTPLMFAAASGDTQAVTILIAHGAEVNAKESAHGQTPLMFAAALNRAAAIKVLMAHRADASLATRIVHLGCGSQFGRDGCDEVDQNGDPLPEKKSGEKTDAKPVDSGADKAAMDALAKAMGLKPGDYRPGKNGDPSDLMAMVEKLSEKIDQIEKRLPGANENARPRFERARATAAGGMTPLLFAARDGQIDAARVLIEGGADINQISPADQTSPLLMAIVNGHLDLANFLLNWGADPNAANDLGLTPLYATVDVQWAPKAWFPQPITGQESVTYLDLMSAMLKDGADPNARLGKKLWFRAFGDHSWVDPSGGTAFWRAAQSTDLETMRLLAEQGADTNLATKGGDTPLMVASGLGWGANFSTTDRDRWIEAARYCVQLGADVNAADTRGYTALHGAAYIGNNDLIKYLIDKGADVKAVAKDKNTVADMANGPTRFGIPHPDTMALLESLGSPNSHNCRSDQCLVAPQQRSGEKPPEAATEAGGKKPGGK